jgi:hypothetical protein
LESTTLRDRRLVQVWQCVRVTRIHDAIRASH